MSLRIVVNAGDVSSAIVTTSNYHPPPQAGTVKLKASVVLRQEAFEFLSMGRNSAGQFSFEYQTEDRFVVDDQRCLTMSQLNSIARRARQHKFGRQSFETLRKMVHDDPDHVFALDIPSDASADHPVSQFNSQFTFALTDDIGLIDAIRFGHGGIIGIDSSWRKKNSSNAPLTVIAALDPISRRGKPLTVMFSANVKQTTLTRFVKWTADRVRDYASRLVDLDRRQWPAELRNMPDRVKEIAEGRFTPQVSTLDKSRAEANTLRSVFGGRTQLKLCNWHISNALHRWEGSVAETADDAAVEGDEDQPEARPQDTVVPKAVRKRLYWSFLTVARAETAVAYAEAKQVLLDTGIAEIVRSEASDRSPDMQQQITAAVRNYLNKNWFTPFWEPCFADHLVPDSIALGDVITVRSGSSLCKFASSFHLFNSEQHARKHFQVSR
jgi:hypothetical protein